MFSKKLKKFFSWSELYNKYLWVVYFKDKLFFDHRYGIDTYTIVPKSELNFSDPYTNEHASRYRPSSVHTIKKCLGIVISHEPDITESMIIDYGCGAGRVLIVAEQTGFKYITGVEFSAELVELCEANLNIYSPSCIHTEINVVHKNAVHYAPPPHSRVFFFYAPFRGTIFDQVLKNIYKSVSEHQRSVYLIFLLCDYPIDPAWTPVARSKEYTIWEIKP